MPYYCTVPRCTSMAGKTVNVSFHQFPRDPFLADTWNRILKRGKPYTKYSKVCSRHFTPADYSTTTVGKTKGQWRSLRKDAIPSQNLPETTPSPQTGGHHRTPRESDVSSEQQLHHQLAHAIYIQTMMAVNAAVTAARASGEQVRQNGSLFGVQDGGENDVDTPSKPMRCEECSKCFKDPDVFMLHKRWHMTQDTTDPQEIINKMLHSNSDIDAKYFQPLGVDPVSLEHHILLAMRLNIESYIKNMLSVDREKSSSKNEKYSENENEVDNESYVETESKLGVKMKIESGIDVYNINKENAIENDIKKENGVESENALNQIGF